MDSSASSATSSVASSSEEPEEVAPQLEAVATLLAEAVALMQGAPEKLQAASTRYMDRPIVPLNDAVRSWCVDQGILEGLTIAIWFRALLASAKQIVFDTRMVVFADGAVAVWGAEKLSFFDLVRNIPVWFSVEGTLHPQ